MIQGGKQLSELSRSFDLSSQPPTLPHFHIPAITPPPAQPYGTPGLTSASVSSAHSLPLLLNGCSN